MQTQPPGVQGGHALSDQPGEDREQAMKDYVALCLRGGEAPFLDLARSAGLKSPFEKETVLEVVHRARSELGD